jgi:hypothetical protein
VGTSAFPPEDGWCVEVAARENGEVVVQEVFSLAEDARDFAKQHVWQHKDHVARIFERRGGVTVFSTEVSFPR